MKRRIRIFLAVTFAVSACGDSDRSSVGGNPSDDLSLPDSVLVESGDELASLLLPAGSLPNGVSASDVALEVIVIDSSEPGVPVMGVQLSPHGLVLSEPARLTLIMPEMLDAGFIAVHQSGSVIEFLDGDLEQDGDGLSFSTTVEHFSEVFLYPDVSAPSSLTLAPQEVSPNQTQLARIKIETFDSFSLWVALPDDEPGAARLFTFALTPSRSPRGSVTWDRQPDRWDPASNNNLFFAGLSASDDTAGWEARQSSKCLIPNTTKVLFTASVVYDASVGRGEPQRKSLIRFESPAEVESPWVAADDDDFIKLDLVSTGDDVVVLLRAVSRADSFCTTTVTSTETTTLTIDTGTDSSTTSSTTFSNKTSTTETPGDEGVGSADDAVGINGIEAIVDAGGEIWWVVYLGSGWIYAMFEAWFSIFVAVLTNGWSALAVGFAGPVGPISSSACETHNGVVSSSGFRPSGDFVPRAYFRPDGAVLLESGLNIDDIPSGTESISVTVESGVWESESGDPPQFSKELFDVPVSEFGSGDPLSDGSLTAACAG